MCVYYIFIMYIVYIYSMHGIYMLCEHMLYIVHIDVIINAMVLLPVPYPSVLVCGISGAQCRSLQGKRCGFPG